MIAALLNEWFVLIIGLLCIAGALILWFRVPVVGHYLGLALAVTGFCLVAYRQGYANALQTENVAGLKKSVEIAEYAAKRANERAAIAEKDNATREELVSRYATSLATRPQCRADAHDVRSLLAIAP